MSLSYAAHINGDKVYDIATGYWIEAKQEAAASAGRMQWSVYLYDDTGTFVEKYAGSSFPEADAAEYEFAGFDVAISSSTATRRVCELYTPSYSLLSGTGTSSTLKQYFSGEQGYAINADYAVIDVQPLAVSDNGVYTAPFSKAYSPVTVDVQEQPWQPLEDGYSNFWFELTNDTLSPWLNFSAKNNDAVIDWGDGSGEVALDTLTPTHTYAKAGKYVVKVKGVTGIARQITTDIGDYYYVLTAAELNSQVVEINYLALAYCKGLKYLYCHNALTEFRSNACQYANLEAVYSPNGYAVLSGNAFASNANLREITIPNTIDAIQGGVFAYNYSLNNITLPSTITSIGSSAFYYCTILYTVHIQATTPPTLGNNTFAGLPSDWICYVPVGYGETYKSASGWSTYADHILEEGQTPNRAMLSKFAKEAKAAAKAAAEVEDK